MLVANHRPTGPRWHKGAWYKRLMRSDERAQEGNVGMLIIGDSITHWWGQTSLGSPHQQPR